jgi:hypothetical protein
MINSPITRKILAIACILALPAIFLIPAAYQAYPCPFETSIMGNPIKFPASIAEFEKAYPTLPAHHRLFARTVFVDSSHQHDRVEWLFRPTLAQRGANTPLYGVNFYLFGRPEQMDSIKTVLEKHFSTKLMPFTSHIDRTSHPSTYYATLADCTTLFIRECDSYEGEPANCIRIAISNHLSDKEESYFIITDGDIEPDID